MTKTRWFHRWLGLVPEPDTKGTPMSTVAELEAQLAQAKADEEAAAAAAVDPSTLGTDDRFAQMEARLADVERRLNGGAVA